MKPYADVSIWKNLRLRRFSQNTNDSELIWHRDKKDRLCVVLYGEGWCYQLDDTFPVELKVGDHFIIPRETYHRVIKGDSSLLLIIKEFEHESTDETSQHVDEVRHKTYPNLRPL